MKYKVNRLSAIVLACAVALSPAIVASQTYPAKNVRLIIPFPPGGSNDIVGRFIATKLSERLGKQVVADNRGGAGGVIGTEAAAKFSWPGFSLARAMNSLTELTGTPGWTAKTFGPVPTLAIAVKALTGS